MLKKYLFWGTPYRFMHESYILMVICAVINLKWLHFDTMWCALNSTASILILIAALLVPIWAGMFIRKYSA